MKPFRRFGSKHSFGIPTCFTSEALNLSTENGIFTETKIFRPTSNFL